MATVLDDVTSESIDARYVQRRVEDWIHRLSALYGELSAATPAGWWTEHGTVTMHEELMRKFKVPPATLPTLSFAHGSSVDASLVPRTLWIIGANGRLDLTVRGERYFVLDLADAFMHPAWRVCPVQDRLKKKPFTPAWLNQALQ